MSALRAILWTAVSTKAQAEDDKASLPAQEADLRALADREGWDVIDVLKVPGHSRRYLDWHGLVNDSLKVGIDAFDKLQRHFDRRDFEILAVRDADRFARTQTLNAYIVESVMDAGAVIWTLSEGKVDEQYRMFIAMSGYRAAAAVDQLKKHREMALNTKPDRGLPVAGMPIWSHRFPRNELGKVVGVVVDESKRRAFNDLAELILDGVQWEDIARIMNERGYRKDDGTSFSPEFFRKTVCHPMWWGHAARYFRGRKHGSYSGAWTYDESYPAPEDVKIWRSVYPAVWTGDEAEEIKAELRRRHSMMKGRADTENTRRFTGLLVCASCGFNLASKTTPRWLGMNCGQRYSKRGCDQPNTISERRIISFLTPLLQELKRVRDPQKIFGDTGRERTQQSLDLARADLEKVHSKARAMAGLYAENAGTALQDIYASELKKLEQQAAELEASIRRAEADLAAITPNRAAVEELDLETFWQQPPRVINQQLHAIFGMWRLVVDHGKIVGYAQAQRHARRRPKPLKR